MESVEEVRSDHRKNPVMPEKTCRGSEVCDDPTEVVRLNRLLLVVKGDGGERSSDTYRHRVGSVGLNGLYPECYDQWLQ
jgi:hypothetical protein